MVGFTANGNRFARRIRDRRVRLVGFLLVIGAVCAGGFFWLWNRMDPGEAVAGVLTVAVRDNEFAPSAVEVPSGSTVTWTWEGAEEHNVVGEGFESPVQREGEFVQTFAEPGPHPYRCTLHYLMRGEVVVTG